MGLAPDAPIDLGLIAKRLGIEIIGLSTFRDEFPDAVHHLSKIDTTAFSAATLQVGPTKRIIVHNDNHNARRQRTNIAHELAHILLGHELGLVLDASGKRIINGDAEEEATWLGSVLLISDAAAVHIVRADMDTETACRTYGVSAPILKMRVNASGAKIRVARSHH
jgi:Zn-dependent peptidase ImmA (M78 family)